MAALPASTRTRLLAELVIVEAQITATNDRLTSIMAQDVESYTLNTGEASQSAKRWDAMKIADLLEKLEAKAQRIRQRLAGLCVMNLNIRRHG